MQVRLLRFAISAPGGPTEAYRRAAPPPRRPRTPRRAAPRPGAGWDGRPGPLPSWCIKWAVTEIRARAWPRGPEVCRLGPLPCCYLAWTPCGCPACAYSECAMLVVAMCSHTPMRTHSHTTALDSPRSVRGGCGGCGRYPRTPATCPNRMQPVSSPEAALQTTHW